jgi:protein-S-isoprenylcysteine O-methyltransferase Ste14
LLSLPIAIHGFYLLRMIGKPENGIEGTTILVKHGAYRYIRHPLYSSLLLLSWGVFFKNASIPSTVLVFFVTVFIVATAKAEEAENLQKFSGEYEAYMKSTKMFIPFLI